jgi:hypothetical protein
MKWWYMPLVFLNPILMRITILMWLWSTMTFLKILHYNYGYFT